MEKLPLNKRESGVSRIVGFDEKTEAKLLDYFRRQFENNSADNKEQEHSPELTGMIGRVNEKLPDFLERYGIDAIFVPSQNIHILDKSRLNPQELRQFEEKHKGSFGFYSSLRQGIAIMRNYQEGDKLPFMNTLVHEMLHLEGFYSYQTTSPEAADINLTKKGEPDANLNIRRSGFSIGTKDGKGLLFNDLNEAIIEELAIRFEREFFGKWPELIQEIKDRDEYIEFVAERDNVDIEKVKETVGSVKKEELPDRTRFKWVSYAYNDARRKLESLLDDLYEKNKADFPSREAVFSLFAKATMTGRLLPVARLIENTYGKGAFREIGEKSETKFTSS